jgi:AraC-like DNA-binding protein
MARAFINVRGAAGLIRAVAARGVDAQRLWELLGVPPSMVNDPDATVDLERVYDVWEAAYARLQDPALAMDITRAGRRPPQDIISFAVMTSPTFGDALETAVRFLRVRATSFRWELVRDGAVLWVVQHREGEDRIGRRLAVEATQAELVMFSRSFSGVDFAPTEVHFEHPVLGVTRAHQELFRCPVTFGAARNAVGLDSRLLSRPMPKGDPALAAYFLEQARQALQRREQAEPEDVTDQVRRVVAQDPRDVPSLEAAARRLGMSGRTLRRRLDEAGSSYQALVDEVRAAIARRHLGMRTLALGEIAYLVGFSEPSAFHRAFKRWTGMTPQEFRASRQAEP